jgi:putative oxidoreductase
MRIELEDTPQPAPVTLVQTIMRLVLGAVCVAHGLNKLQAPAAYAAELAELGLPRPEVLTQAVLGLELLAGAALVIGRFSRSAAFVALCDAAAAAVVHWTRSEGFRSVTGQIQLEAMLLAVSSCAFFMVVGGGPFALDALLRRRARLRAIARDETWDRPPYVT